MKTSETITKIAPALVKAINAMGGASKDADNPFFKSKYTTLGNAVAAAKEALTKNDICVLQDQNGITEHSTVNLVTRLLHSSGEWIETTCEAKPKSFTPQDIGSSITYLRRYGLMAALSIPSEDDDGNGASQGTQQPDVKQPKKNGASKNQAVRKLYSDLEGEIDACGDDLDALTLLSESDEFRSKIKELPADWQRSIRERGAEAKTAAVAASGGLQ